MSQLDHDIIRAGVERRLATVETLVPPRPAWRTASDHDIRPALIRVGAGPAVRNSTVGSRRLGLLLVVGAVVLTLAYGLAGGGGQPSTVPPEPIAQPWRDGHGRATHARAIHGVRPAPAVDRAAADDPGPTRDRLDAAGGRSGRVESRLSPRRCGDARIQRWPVGDRAARGLRPSRRDQTPATSRGPDRMDPGPSRPRVR